MKKLIIYILSVLPFCIANGQDKIITTQKDTIQCRILSISPTHINYEQKTENQTIAGRFIPINNVSEYYWNSQPQERKSSEKPSTPWLIGIQAGGSHLLASTADAKREMMNFGISKSQADDYFRSLKNGFHISGDLHYLIENFFSLGVKYSFFTSSAEADFTIRIDDYLYTPYPIFVVMDCAERLYINYIGPSAFFQQTLDRNDKFRLSQTISLGYVNYRSELRSEAFLGFNAIAKAHRMGGTLGLSFEYFPVSWLSVGVNAEAMYVLPIKEVEMITIYGSETIKLEKNDYEKLSRLNYSLGVRFHF